MQNVYALVDLVAGRWTGSLVVDRSDAPVIRMFHDLLADERQPFKTHAADYELHRIGRVSDEGVLDGYGETVCIATGSQWLAAQAPTLRKEA